MTFAETTAVLAIAKAASGMVVDHHTISVWTDMLHDVSVAEGVRAMKDFLATEHRRPTIADIRRRVAMAKAPPIDAGSAWGEVQRKISSVGRYREPKWSHPATAAAVDAIGWQAICSTDMDDVGTLRAQFERYLKAFVERAQYAANVGALEGPRPAGQLTAGDAVQDYLEVLTATHDDEEAA